MAACAYGSRCRTRLDDNHPLDMQRNRKIWHGVVREVAASASRTCRQGRVGTGQGVMAQESLWHIPPLGASTTVEMARERGGSIFFLCRFAPLWRSLSTASGKSGKREGAVTRPHVGRGCYQPGCTPASLAVVLIPVAGVRQFGKRAECWFDLADER